MSENKYKELREKLTYAPKNGYARLTEADKAGNGSLLQALYGISGCGKDRA